MPKGLASKSYSFSEPTSDKMELVKSGTVGGSDLLKQLLKKSVKKSSVKKLKGKKGLQLLLKDKK
jgi:hypothetical protein